MNGFVKSVLAQNHQANIVVLGDLNDFQFSETLALVRGQELTNLVDKLDEKERYSYIYEGNSQTLDHLLVSPSISKSSVLDIVHINADFSAADGRVSDHDPLVAQIDLPRQQWNRQQRAGVVGIKMMISRRVMAAITLGTIVAVTRVERRITDRVRLRIAGRMVTVHLALMWCKPSP